MTDFDTEILREEEKTLPVQAEKDAQHHNPTASKADPALAAAMAARSRAEPVAPEAKPEAAQAAKARPVPPDPELHEISPDAGPEEVANALSREQEAPRKGKAEARREKIAADASRSRQRQLTQTLAVMSQSPEAVRLDLLVASYQAAEPGEVELVADAVVAFYLRAEPDIRRRLRPALATAVREQSGAALALALSARLGALVMSSAPPPAPPSPPAPEP
uniref:hypothetical protein n=1 Tax=uncultured Halomonas sp. TaxID=173971 RepID=UPI00263169CE|nr:hypothetical protein [uncultured Halomonas sp.]